MKTIVLNQRNLFLWCAIQSMVYRAYTMFHGKTWDDIEIGYAYDLMKNWASDLIADHQLVGSIHIAYNEEVWPFLTASLCLDKGNILKP
jgi:hypothetical protein